MEHVTEQADCERRIQRDIVVDAYGDSERAMSWYYYLEDALRVRHRSQPRPDCFWSRNPNLPRH